MVVYPRASAQGPRLCRTLLHVHTRARCVERFVDLLAALTCSNTGLSGHGEPVGVRSFRRSLSRCWLQGRDRRAQNRRIWPQSHPHPTNHMGRTLQGLCVGTVQNGTESHECRGRQAPWELSVWRHP